MRMEPGTEPCGSVFIIRTKYHLIVLVSTRLTPMVRSLHVNSSEIRCVIPMTDVFEHILGSAAVPVYTRFLTYRRADSISTKAGLQCLLCSQIKPNEPLQSKAVGKAKISDSLSPEGEGIMLMCVAFVPPSLPYLSCLIH